MTVDLMLRQLLGVLRVASDAPLRSAVDGPGAAAAILGRCSDDQLAQLASPAARLNAALRRAIAGEDGTVEEPSWSDPAGECRVAVASAWNRRAIGCELAAWLEQLHAAIGAIDRRGVEMILLRLEGADDRRIAERLDTGLWLVRRILHEIRQALADGRDRGEST